MLRSTLGDPGVAAISAVVPVVDRAITIVIDMYASTNSAMVPVVPVSAAPGHVVNAAQKVVCGTPGAHGMLAQHHVVQACG